LQDVQIPCLLWTAQYTYFHHRDVRHAAETKIQH
jgi:hypothetical protein